MCGRFTVNTHRCFSVCFTQILIAILKSIRIIIDTKPFELSGRNVLITAFQTNQIFISKREGGLRAVLESSAVGLPTIGRNYTGLKDMIIDNKTGCLVR